MKLSVINSFVREQSYITGEIFGLAHSLKYTYFQIFFKIRFPAALPHIFSRAKLAVTMAVIDFVILDIVWRSDCDG